MIITHHTLPKKNHRMNEEIPYSQCCQVKSLFNEWKFSHWASNMSSPCCWHGWAQKGTGPLVYMTHDHFQSQYWECRIFMWETMPEVAVYIGSYWTFMHKFEKEILHITIKCLLKCQSIWVWCMLGIEAIKPLFFTFPNCCNSIGIYGESQKKLHFYLLRLQEFR